MKIKNALLLGYFDGEIAAKLGLTKQRSSRICRDCLFLRDIIEREGFSQDTWK